MSSIDDRMILMQMNQERLICDFCVRGYHFVNNPNGTSQ